MSAGQAAYNAVWDRGECLATVSGLPYQRIEAGEEFSLLVLLDQKTGQPMDGMMPLWFRNGDMRVEGDNGER